MTQSIGKKIKSFVSSYPLFPRPRPPSNGYPAMALEAGVWDNVARVSPTAIAILERGYGGGMAGQQFPGLNPLQQQMVKNFWFFIVGTMALVG